MRLGIDLDNTLVRYDRLFAALAVEWSLLPEAPAGGKQAVRDAVRAAAGGEAAWQALQAEAYGPAMDRAELFDGADGFLTRAREAEIEVRIISHKTQHAAATPDGANLHQAALAWLDARGFFDSAGFGLAREHVVFLPTRTEKLRAIAEAGCTHFVDDLEEVLAHPAFPPEVVRYLFAPIGAVRPGPYKTCRSWPELSDELLDAA